jgi:hypothetical protein
VPPLLPPPLVPPPLVPPPLVAPPPVPPPFTVDEGVAARGGSTRGDEGCCAAGGRLNNANGGGGVHGRTGPRRRLRARLGREGYRFNRNCVVHMPSSHLIAAV